MLKRTNSNSTINFMYFMFNFPSGFISKVWTGTMVSHLESKWLASHERYKSPTLAFSQWFMELDQHNKTKLLDWIEENYSAVS